MNEHDIQKELTKPRPSEGPTAECPDEHALAALAAGDWPMDPEGAQALREHLGDCAWCIEQLALLARAEDLPDADVPELLRARVARLGDGSTAAPAPRRIAGWATAAVLVLAVGFGYQQMQPRPGGEVAPGAAPPEGAAAPSPGDFRQVRSLDTGRLGPRILTPAEGDTLAGAGAAVEWTAVDGSLYYDVRLVSADGELLREERVAANEWALPSDLALEPGADYYLRVDAFMEEARRLSSRHVRFTIPATEGAAP